MTTTAAGKPFGNPANTFATAAGCDSIATWLAGSTVVFALIWAAMAFS